ncbi:prolipoprotein diacylglyceryl transferase [Tundrisphaera sp. TA3]|uniref:prolipoprotein diacylglyceryl transferase n=1 Tax=Tundrisphaera sp. TA3 TaxID=3435775 RepID=UPI003EBB2EAA
MIGGSAMGATVPWVYPLIMMASVGTAILLRGRTPQPSGLDPRQRWGIGLGAFCGAMIGAKLPFALADWEGLLTGRAWAENGKTIVFGMVGGYLGVEIAKALLGVRVKTGDGFAVPVAGAVAVGRLSCFAAGCCHGVATRLPWGVDFGDGVRRHPTQLYEIAFHAAAALGLAALQRRGLFRGQLIKLYILGYLAYRFATEFIRPEPRLAGGLTGYQWACLGLAPVFLALWARDARSMRARPGMTPEITDDRSSPPPGRGNG